MILVAVFLVGVLLGAVVQCGAAARYRRMWREAVKLIQSMEEARDAAAAFRMPPRDYKALHQLVATRARARDRPYKQPPVGW